jgi:transcriptional regulator with XRE-family HTH domain
MHLYERLLAEYLRKKRGDETVRSFARKIGLTHGTLHRIENLQQSVTLGRLGSIMDKLNCSWDDIFGKAPIRQKSTGRSKSGAVAVSKGPK